LKTPNPIGYAEKLTNRDIKELVITTKDSLKTASNSNKATSTVGVVLIAARNNLIVTTDSIYRWTDGWLIDLGVVLMFVRNCGGRESEGEDGEDI